MNFSDPVTLGVWGLIAAVLGAVGGPLIGYLLYRRAKEERLPTWVARSVVLVNQEYADLAGLTIMQGDKRLLVASLAHVALWNRGRQAIEREHLGVKDPISIATRRTDVEILSTKVLLADPDNDVRISDSGPHCVSIDFNYLDQGEGAVFQLVHTGTSDADIGVSGHIRGASLTGAHETYNFMRKGIPFLSMGWVALWSTLLLVVESARIGATTVGDSQLTWGLVGAFLLAIAGMVVLAIVQRRFNEPYGIPKPLRTDLLSARSQTGV